MDIKKNWLWFSDRVSVLMISSRINLIGQVNEWNHEEVEKVTKSSLVSAPGLQSVFSSLKWG